MHLLSRFALAALIATLSRFTNAHTWPEELQVIGPNGSYIGDRGFTRGYVARTDPTFDGDANILWLLPSLDARMPDETVRLRINSSDLLCHPNQRTSNYTNPAYPKLKVSPGGNVAIKYLENGHVTLPWNQAGKPPLGGTVFVYGTTQPSTTEKMADVLQWTADGTGGDKRGSLLTAQTFDDGRCHQINDCVNSAIRQVLYPNMIPDQPTSPGQEQWCETDVTIPSNQQMGDLTLYWIWQWPTAAATDCTCPDGKDEYYTSCIDVEIVQGGPGDVKIADEFAQNTLLQENFQTKAVSTYRSRVALTASPSYTLENWGRVVGKRTAAANPAFSTSCSSVLSSLAENAGVPPPSCPAGLYATGALFASISSSVLSSHNTAVFIAPGVTESFPAATQPPASPVAPAPSARPPRPAPTAPPPSGGVTDTVMSTFIHTITLTRVVTETSGVPPQQSDSPPGPPAGQQRAGSQWGPGWGGPSSEPQFKTISTIGRAPAASGRPPRNGSGIASEHIARHRRHARHFG